MASYSDALRGYGYKVMKRDDFVCQYCGLDGKESFSNWLNLSLDHLLPKGHPERENAEFHVTACFFCNAADNRYFDSLEGRGLSLENKTRAELVAQRKEWVERTRQNYRNFWVENVQKG